MPAWSARAAARVRGRARAGDGGGGDDSGGVTPPSAATWSWLELAVMRLAGENAVVAIATTASAPAITGRGGRVPRRYGTTGLRTRLRSPCRRTGSSISVQDSEASSRVSARSRVAGQNQSPGAPGWWCGVNATTGRCQR